MSGTNVEIGYAVSVRVVDGVPYEAYPCGTCGEAVLRSIGHGRRFSRAFCSRRCAALAASQANAAKSGEPR